MPLSDYAHHNEDALYIWYHEEGKHHDADLEAHYADDFDDDPEFYECVDAPDECLREGNFDQRGGESHWNCSTCGTGPFVELPEGGFAYAGE